MSQIDRIGNFRGYAIDSGIGETKNGYPQWVASLQAAEYYDEDTEQWIDWSQYAESEITAYCVLFGGDGNPTLTAKQLQKALGWSGQSLQELNSDYSQTLIQFRVEERTYRDNTSLQATWIDHADAEPGRTINKLEAEDVKKLDSKYAAALRKLGGGPKPKSVPAKPETPKPTKPVDKDAAKKALRTKTEEKAARAKAAEEKATKKQAPPKPSAPGKKETCTLEQAWESVYSAKGDMSDDDLGKIWLETIDKYGDQDTLSPAEWAVVRDEVIVEINPS